METQTMSKHDKASPLTIVLGTAIAGTLGTIGIANAADTEEVFAMEDLTTGQLMAGGHEEGGCGEGKCSGDKEDGDKEGSCGGDGEGSCGGDA
jgi:uncharacterized low-complexity protein